MQDHSDDNCIVSLPHGLPGGLLLKIGKTKSLCDIAKNVLGCANLYGFSGPFLLRQLEGLCHVQWEGGDALVQHQRLP